MHRKRRRDGVCNQMKRSSLRTICLGVWCITTVLGCGTKAKPAEKPQTDQQKKERGVYDSLGLTPAKISQEFTLAAQGCVDPNTGGACSQAQLSSLAALSALAQDTTKLFSVASEESKAQMKAAVCAFFSPSVARAARANGSEDKFAMRLTAINIQNADAAKQGLATIRAVGDTFGLTETDPKARSLFANALDSIGVVKPTSEMSAFLLKTNGIDGSCN